MKKICLFITTLVLSTALQAQIKMYKPSPASKIEQIIGLTDVSLSYSRPSMNGRTIYGNLVPYGKLWRSGANANTKITFSDDVKVNGNELKKGSYALYTKPSKDSWEVIFYNDSDNWGTPKEWNESKVATKFTVKPTAVPLKFETLTYMFGDLKNDSGVLNLLWENTGVALKIEVSSKETILSNIEKTMAGPNANDHYKAAIFYYDIEDYAKAKDHIDKSFGMNKEPKFWMIRKQSLIYAKSGDKKGAIEAAKKSLELAEKAGNLDYVKLNKDSIAEWGK